MPKAELPRGEKTRLIKEVLTKHPNLGVTDVQRKIKEESGVEVKVSHIHILRLKMQSRKDKKPTRSQPPAPPLTAMESLRVVGGLVELMGGVSTVKAAVANFEPLAVAVKRLGGVEPANAVVLHYEQLAPAFTPSESSK